MDKQKMQLIEEEDYRSREGVILFEDEHSFSFGIIEFDDVRLKFGWNSKEVQPQIKFIKKTSLLFVGIDVFVVAYDYNRHMVAFYLNTSTNFKWFDEIENGIALVTETGIILINTTSRCTLKNCFFFGDIIMGTKVENNEIKVSFLVNEDEIINM